MLLVEDEPLIRMLLADELVEAGYRVIEAMSGDEALVLMAARADIDVLVTDVRMPGTTDGLAVAGAFAERHPGAAIIVTSGHAHPTDGLPVGALFLRKPYLTADVVILLREMLRQRQAPAAPHRPVPISD